MHGLLGEGILHQNLPIIYDKQSTRIVKAHHVGIKRRPMEQKMQVYDVDADLRTMCKEGRLYDAVDYFELVHKGGLQPAAHNFSFLLQECAKSKSLADGMKIHTLLLKNDVKLDIGMKNYLLNMYAKCGSLFEAWHVFEEMRGRRDVVSWTVMINAYAQESNRKEVFRIFRRMLNKKVRPNKITLVCMLKACNSAEALDDGKVIHEYAIKRLLDTNIYVGGALVEMYLKCGSIAHARKVFNKIRRPHIELWNTMITCFMENKQDLNALKLFQQMLQASVDPSEAMLLNALKACSNLASLQGGKWLHFCICESKLELDVCLRRGLVEMYTNSGSLEDAKTISGGLDEQALIDASTGYAEFGDQEEMPESLDQIDEALTKVCSKASISLDV